MAFLDLILTAATIAAAGGFLILRLWPWRRKATAGVCQGCRSCGAKRQALLRARR